MVIFAATAIRNWDLAMVVLVSWLPLIFWLSWSPKYKCPYDYTCYGYANAPEVFRFAHIFYLFLRRIRKPCKNPADSFAVYITYLTFGSLCRCFSYPPVVRVIHEDQRSVVLSSHDFQFRVLSHWSPQNSLSCSDNVSCNRTPCMNFIIN